MNGTVAVILVLILTKATYSYYFPTCFQNYYIIETHPRQYETSGSFYIDIRRDMDVGTEVRLNFSSTDPIISMEQPIANLTKLSDSEYKIILLHRANYNFRAFVSGIDGQRFIGKISSVKIDGLEHCKTPTFGYNKWEYKYDDEIKEIRLICGQRKINHNQLIVFGGEAKPGDWPWHVALNRISENSVRYICGGTLITDNIVMTAAHCASRHGVAVLPKLLSVSLGKLDLIGYDKDSQERKVLKVMVHEEFVYKKLDNDIALLELRTPAIFNDYIQPACLWFDVDAAKIPSGQILGSVAGWGYDQSKSLSTNLRYTKMPIVQDITCIRRKPKFYASFMNGKRFCAGTLNGTSPCNGDSGGGFIVYVPNSPKRRENSGGIWFVRGIVSLAYYQENDNTICDPNEYVLFTDINQYKNWIENHLKINKIG